MEGFKGLGVEAPSLTSSPVLKGGDRVWRFRKIGFGGYRNIFSCFKGRG